MKLAFLILVHRYPQQAIRLVSTLLKEEDATIFIHVDAKSEVVYKLLKNKFSDEKNVIFTAKRYKVYWGSYNQIKATTELMHTAFKFGKHNAYTLLSGQDFPIKSISTFKEFLSKNPEKEFIPHFPLPNPETWDGNGGMDRMQLYWIDAKIQRYSYTFGRINGILHKTHRFLKYKRNLKFSLYGGGNWFTLSNNAVTYILNYLNENPRYLKRYRYTRCADEIYIQTILMNSPLKNNVVNDDLRYINWTTGPEFPKILRTEDYDVLINSENKFFGRKFDEIIDSVILDKFSTFNK
jgi:hypothetical protein